MFFCSHISRARNDVHTDQFVRHFSQHRNRLRNTTRKGKIKDIQMHAAQQLEKKNRKQLYIDTAAAA